MASQPSPFAGGTVQPGPVELGRHDGPVRAVAALPDGRVVSGGDDGRVLVWDPARAERVEGLD